MSDLRGAMNHGSLQNSSTNHPFGKTMTAPRPGGGHPSHAEVSRLQKSLPGEGVPGCLGEMVGKWNENGRNGGVYSSLALRLRKLRVGTFLLDKSIKVLISSLFYCIQSSDVLEFQLFFKFCVPILRRLLRRLQAGVHR